MPKKCVICGKPSGMYPLCREHLQMKTNGEVAKCEDCGEWYVVKNGCECKKTTEQISHNHKCLLCGNETADGYLYCKSCYFKYKDKSIIVNIKNLSEFIIVDQYGNRNVKTDNGMYVRSQQEKIIYDEFYKRNIRCEYEKTLFYKDENGETQSLHPDFYLPDYGLYIEHWGYENVNNKNYLKTKKFKQKIYESNGYKVAGTNCEDINDISAAIDRILFENDIKINN